MTARTRISRRTRDGVAALAGAALISGGLVLAAPMASATDVGTSPAPTSTASTADPIAATPHRSHRHHERATALTAPEVASVTAAVVAKYPGATVRHIVLDAHGVYRARILTADGQRVSVKVSKDFTVLSAHVLDGAKWDGAKRDGTKMDGARFDGTTFDGAKTAAAAHQG